MLAAACGLSEHPTPAPAVDPAGPEPGSGGPGGAPAPGPGGAGGASRDAGARPADAAAAPRDAGVDRPRRDSGSSRPADTAAPVLDGGAAPPSSPPPSSPPPLPGVPGDLVIGGKSYPKDKALVIVHIGHSNMAGRTDKPPEMRPFHFEPHPQLWSFSTGMFVPAKEPLSGDYLTRGRAGPGMSLLKATLAMAPDAAVISIGRGQDGSRGGACKAFRRGGLLYDSVMNPAKQLKGKVTFAGIFSMLVLMEIFDKPNLVRSHECMEGVARDMREDLGDPNIPFIMSDWEAGATGRFNPTLPDAVRAREQLKIAQQNIPRSAIVPTDMLPMSDDHHFDLTGYKIWGERALALVRDGGWAPWATTPR